MKGSVIRPLLMLIFVVLMVFLMQQEVENKEELQKQQTEIDPGSVIYSDIGVLEGEFVEEAETEIVEEDSKEVEAIEMSSEKEGKEENEKAGEVTIEGETMEK